MNLETIRKIQIVSSAPGAAETVDSLNKVAAAQANVGAAATKTATVIDVATKSQLSAAEAYRRQTLTIDEQARAQDRLEKAVRTATQAFNQGILGDQQSAEAKAALIKRINDLNQYYGQASSGASKFNDVLGVGRQLLGAFGVALSVTAVVEWGKRVFESTAQLENQAKVLGVSTDALQAYHAAAVLSGAGADVGDDAIRRFTRSIGDATEKVGPARQAFQQLHLTAKDLAGGTESALPKAAQALLDIKDKSERARLEIALFSRSGQQVEQVLQKWADPELAQHMKDMGLTIDEAFIERAHKAEIAWDTFWLKFNVQFVEAIQRLPEFGQKVKDAFVPPPGAPYVITPEGLVVQTGAAPARGHLPAMTDASKLPFATASTQAMATANRGGADWSSQSHELQNYLDKLNEAVRLAGELPLQREKDQALIAAATAAQKDYVSQLEASGATQIEITRAKAVEITTADQARKMLGDQKVAIIQNQVEQEKWNSLAGAGLQGIDDIVAGLRAQGVQYNSEIGAGLKRISDIKQLGVTADQESAVWNDKRSEEH